MQRENQPSIEYNLAGGLLMTIGERDLLRLGEKLKTAGYTHACALPFRGLTGPHAITRLARYPLTVVHCENIWNEQTPDYPLPIAVVAGLVGHLRRKLGDLSEPPLLQDTLFAGKPTCDRLLTEMLELPGVKLISHTIEVKANPDKFLLEINPGIKMSAQELQEWARQNSIGVVFDPRHLLPEFVSSVSTPSEPTCQSKSAWEKQFEAFRSSIEVVDINPPTPQDVPDLLQGRGLLHEVAQAAKELKTVRFLRVEIPIPPLTQIPYSPLQPRGFSLMTAVAQTLKEA